MRNIIRFSSCFILLAAIASLAQAGAGDCCWVYLREPELSPRQLQVALNQARSLLSERCLTRRAKIRAPNELADEFDLPLNQAIVDSITAHGFTVYTQSKYLRAVSVWGSYEQVKVLETLPYVKEIVPAAKSVPEPFQECSNSSLTPQPPSRSIPIKQGAKVQWNEAQYGYTYHQLRMMNIIAAHNRGFTGQGVLLGMNDAGFNRINRRYVNNDPNKYHVMFDSLQVFATRNFITNDTDVTEQRYGVGTHGTNSLSCIAGLQDSFYIGAAPRVMVSLAKTERTDTTNVPGDYTGNEPCWVRGLEWHDSLGADIFSSSVSWVAWLPDSIRNGRTAASSRAVLVAAAHGVVVVNSAGNHGDGSFGGPHISCPGDADSMICTGAVNTDSTYAWFSSRGPTRDGRIKPDLTTQGINVAVADAYSTTRSSQASGTSFSAPSMAGACAVVLSSNLRLTPMQLIHIMKRSADRWNNPDTLYGWGIPNVNVAVDSALRLADTGQPDNQAAAIPEQYVIRAFPNPFNPSVILFFAPTIVAREITVYNELGRKVDHVTIAPGSSRVSYAASHLAVGTYFLRFPGGAATRVTLVR